MFGSDFYPTPPDLISTMLAKVDLDTVSTVLEPSAGRGDIVEAINSRTRYGRTVSIDAIELDAELSMVLAGKGHKPIAADFLTFRSYRPYDLVIMNPPFSSGDTHLLKALDLQKDGGTVVCLLNAETIRNPHTNVRKDLLNRLERYAADIEYIEGAFKNADRQTGIEVALVTVSIEHKPQSDILTRLLEAKKIEYAATGEPSELVEGDYINGAVRRYEIEAEAGLKFLNEYYALKPMLSRSFDAHRTPIIELVVDGDKYDEPRTAFIERLRMKYWRELFQSNTFAGLFTSKTREDYTKRIDELKRYEFNRLNIKQMQVDISGAMLESLDDSIVRLFDEFSNQYWDEQANNIHYYNGWKTNKAYVINKKVITRLQAFGYSYQPDGYDVTPKLADVEKVFGYLDGELSTDQADMMATLKKAKEDGQSRDIDLKYCSVTFYKKGTAHIVFKRADLLKKFNLIGSQRKGWLPPDYGTKSYERMTQVDKDLVDAFEGIASYRDTKARHDFYVSRPRLELASGTAA